MDGRDLLADRYELRGVLGRGGMAEVHDGWDTRLQRPVAIKLLYQAFNADANMRRRFEDEARAAAGLNHPNIVAVHDCGEHDGTPFIVMERLPGRTLHDDIAMGPMPPERVRAMLHDVLGALGCAHAAGIVHRDIKPGNVLIAPNSGAMKVADFGIAKTAGAALTATGQLVGTMAYMSPERVAGAPASAADDLYAVGVMGYEALTGQRPFPQENPAALLHAILDTPPPPISAIRPDIDPVLAATIDRAMGRDVSQRFGSAEHMRAALTGAPSALLLGPAPASAPRPATKVMAQPLAPSANYYVAPAPRRRPMSRERKLLLAAAGFVAFVVSGLALALDPSSSTQSPQPINTSTPVQPPPPPTATPPPPPTAASPVFEEPKKKDEKKGEQGRGNGRGNGNGNGKKDD
ncbi:serine/threonine-protein kinase [Mycolicibacterium celeriflavum]|uniref:non-specific serine/threonine protein kinase n=1 Tax=Mycolicibacterium celeriflavum TaxID=1249101 RepID=A0A1X0BSL2_MYCCF|nr:serine/threonine-protein kinase [Mycolicibacterium celeriflavum]MCV7238477.1 serine/threonine protein kinase [Mycolicibacterium celeriflavum]ORA46689.1 serine/threonine protein kinase [Mycolicibacterium celeriflavum]BBY44713.1 protein kinase [Mycolicibacterium celeriflavum]